MDITNAAMMEAMMTGTMEFGVKFLALIEKSHGLELKLIEGMAKEGGVTEDFLKLHQAEHAAQLEVSKVVSADVRAAFGALGDKAEIIATKVSTAFAESEKERNRHALDLLKEQNRHALEMAQLQAEVTKLDPEVAKLQAKSQLATVIGAVYGEDQRALLAAGLGIELPSTVDPDNGHGHRA